MDNTQKFSGKAEVYRQSRPSYSPEMFNCLRDQFGVIPGCLAADVGCGTGILTRQLLEMGIKVFAVEPNADMRRLAEQDLGLIDGFISVDASAEDTNLPDESVDFIFAASAFHWFDLPAFKVECKRILKPGGRVFLIWNEAQLSDEIQQGRQEVLKKYAYGAVNNPMGSKKNPGAKEEFFDGKMAMKRFPNPIVYEKERFVGRALSSSYSLTRSHKKFEEYLADLEALFDQFAIDGVITEAQETVLFFKAETGFGNLEPQPSHMT